MHSSKGALDQVYLSDYDYVLPLSTVWALTSITLFSFYKNLVYKIKGLKLAKC
jgi:hypothetical protein